MLVRHDLFRTVLRRTLEADLPLLRREAGTGPFGFEWRIDFVSALMQRNWE
jgi:hypothetical protein